MELRQLRYFVAVAEEGNISRAARKIHLTQPALSRQIKALEEEIGQCLLERSAHAIKLTPVGESLFREARDLLRHADSMLDRVRESGRGMRLRVGFAPSLAAHFLPVAVASFTKGHPDTRVALFDLSTTELLAWLERDQLDVAITARLSDKPRSLRWKTLTRAPWRLALRRSHPLAQASRVCPTDLAQERWSVFHRRDYPEYWELLATWLRQHALRPVVAGEFDSAESLMASVEAGMGVALVTASAAQRCPDRVQLKQLSAPPPPLSIAAAYLASRVADKSLMSFIAEMRRAASTDGDKKNAS